MLPYDTKSIILNTTNASTSCPTLLEATTTPRTLLKAVILSDTSGNYAYVRIGTNIYLHNQDNRVVETETPISFVNQNVNCVWETGFGNGYYIAISYVDFNLIKYGEEEKQFLIENPTSSFGNFYLDKNYSYGEITLVLVNGAILLCLLFYILKRLFFHEETTIHSIHQKNF